MKHQGMLSDVRGPGNLFEYGSGGGLWKFLFSVRLGANSSIQQVPALWNYPFEHQQRFIACLS